MRICQVAEPVQELLGETELHRVAATLLVYHRRYLLDCLRRGEVDRCEELLSIMDDTYGVMVTIDFPDAVTGGLRRTTDIVRGILEKTRGDLTLSFRQRDLEKKLAAFEQKLSMTPIKFSGKED